MNLLPPPYQTFLQSNFIALGAGRQMTALLQVEFRRRLSLARLNLGSSDTGKVEYVVQYEPMENK
jgi:hypothetical protein